MKSFLTTMLAVGVVFLSVAELGFVGNAEPIIGMPWTPMSYAGVARRSMYREAAVASTVAVNAAAMNAAAANMAAANAAAAAANAQRAASQLPIGTMVPNLPPGCNSTVIGGVDYFNCGGVFYRAGFQGNNIVYIVSQP